MPDVSTLLAFSVPAMLLLVVPGPVSCYIMARGIEQGRPAAVTVLLGVQCGDLLHIIAAACGFGTLYTSSPVLAGMLTYGGAGYLFLLAVQAVRAGGVTEREGGVDGSVVRSLRRVFWQSLLINVLSPQTALFYLAFLPVFITPQRGAVFAQFMMLGICFLLLGLLIEGGYAMNAGWLGDRLRTNPAFGRVQRWVTGSIYAVIGAGAVAGIG
jgi:threonine/homoserine/homoserine lactone efflux protein